MRRTSLLVLALGALCCGDDDESADVDSALAQWPAAYQQFIRSVGGARFEELDGARMHYIETGPADGEVVLLVHGIPTQAFLWRNVIPSLASRRVVAVDLIGYGRSDRPAGLPYTPRMNADFLTQFIEQRGYQRVHIVAHDLGGPVALRWAFENPNRVASITMFETLWTRVDGVEAIPSPFGGRDGILATMRDPEQGPVLVGEQNIFLAELSSFTASGLSAVNQEVYEFPWPNAADRVRVFLPSGPLAFPFPSDPEARAFIGEYQDFLAATDIPKLVIDVVPGLLSRIEIQTGTTTVGPGAFAAAMFPNVTLVTLQPGGHFAQEDLGPQLGQAIDAFVSDVTQ